MDFKRNTLLKGLGFYNLTLSRISSPASRGKCFKRLYMGNKLWAVVRVVPMVLHYLYFNSCPTCSHIVFLPLRLCTVVLALLSPLLLEATSSREGMYIFKVLTVHWFGGRMVLLNTKEWSYSSWALTTENPNCHWKSFSMAHIVFPCQYCPARPFMAASRAISCSLFLWSAWLLLPFYCYV